MSNIVYKCANEGEFCRPYGSKTIYGEAPSKIIAYGADGSYYFKNADINDQSIPCNNTFFGGDPKPGAKKYCYVKDVPNNIVNNGAT